MTKNQFENSLLETAEKIDKKFSADRIILLKQSYEFFKSIGLSADEIKATMALTSHEIRLINKKK